MAIYSLCINCKKRVPYKTKRCPECQSVWTKEQEKYRDEDIRRFRNSKWWKIKSKQIMKDYHYACQICKHNGIDREAEEVHHIVPLAADFDKRLDDSNLIPLCSQCHDDVHDGEVNIPPGVLEGF